MIGSTFTMNKQIKKDRNDPSRAFLTYGRLGLFCFLIVLRLR